MADANLDRDIVAGILRREPEVDFELPQGWIPEGMQDPEVLAVAASLMARAIEEILPIWHISAAELWTSRFRRLPL